MAASKHFPQQALGLTIADAAVAMGVGRRTLERWIASGSLRPAGPELKAGGA